MTLHLQMMINLKHDYLWLHAQFTEQGYHTVWQTSKPWASPLDRPCNRTNHNTISQDHWWFDKGTWNNSICEKLMGFSTLQSWGKLEQLMRYITRTANLSSEQHVELGSSSWNRDFDDLTVHSWLQQFDERLRFLSSGFPAKSGNQVNCDDPKVVGCNIQEQIDVAVTEAKVPGSQKVHNLLQLTKAIKAGKQDVHINPAILFTCWLVLVGRSEDPVSYFQYELARYQASIFNGDYMRHIHKALLGHAITDRKKN